VASDFIKINTMDNFKRAQAKVVGPGGIKCPCCTLFNKKNAKKKTRKIGRAVMKQELHQIKRTYGINR
jgi:hypothetical protein